MAGVTASPLAPLAPGVDHEKRLWFQEQSQHAPKSADPSNWSGATIGASPGPSFSKWFEHRSQQQQPSAATEAAAVPMPQPGVNSVQRGKAAVRVVPLPARSPEDTPQISGSVHRLASHNPDNDGKQPPRAMLQQQAATKQVAPSTSCCNKTSCFLNSGHNLPASAYQPHKPSGPASISHLRTNAAAPSKRSVSFAAGQSAAAGGGKLGLNRGGLRRAGSGPVLCSAAEAQQEHHLPGLSRTASAYKKHQGKLIVHHSYWLYGVYRHSYPTFSPLLPCL